MGWTLCEIGDEAKLRLDTLRTKSEWYEALGALNLGMNGDLVCDLQDSYPLWIEATKDQAEPLCFLFQGEIRAEPGAGDPAVGFLSAATVSDLAVILGWDDAFFLKLLTETEFSRRHQLNCSNELTVLPSLRAFFGEAARRNKAAVVLLS